MNVAAEHDPSRPFSAAERAHVERLNRALWTAFATPAGRAEAVTAALRTYLATRAALGRRTRSFGIANHRIFRVAEDRAGGVGLLVPYALAGELYVFLVDGRDSRLEATRFFPHGTLFTDQLIAAVVGRQGEPIDLERHIYDFDIGAAPAQRVHRVQDIAALLSRLNGAGSRHEAAYYLRVLITRLCGTTLQGSLPTKNLQPELRNLSAELSAALDGPFAAHLRLPMRVVVKKVSGLLASTNLIDQLWHDTIALAEVHGPGSAITNELRRSAHHALGKGTLELARGYRDWLQSGDLRHLPPSLRTRVTAADHAARRNHAACAAARRIAEVLDKLLGDGHVVARLEDWADAYRTAPLRCDNGRTVAAELEALLDAGVRRDNRWSYLHHLRTLRRKAAASGQGASHAALAALQRCAPGDPGFDGRRAERAARHAAGLLGDELCAAQSAPLLEGVAAVANRYREGDHLAAFVAIAGLRNELAPLARQRAFQAQAYLLLKLDCLLEEMGYFALRHVAGGYDEHGPCLAECFRIIHLCAANLRHDGLFSRELWDLTVMLLHPHRAAAELLDVLEAVQRTYHQMVQRVSAAYEMMGHQLGLSDDEIRAVHGNFQRYLHDLNSMVHFTDVARAHLRAAPGAGAPPAAERPKPAAWDVIHLSHADDINARVESTATEQSLQDLYGGKGAGLVYLSYLGIPTRDAFILPTTVARSGRHRREAGGLRDTVRRHLAVLERDVERERGGPARYGDPRAPLLLAVRGGSVFTLPGLLSTVVFVGINDEVAAALADDDAWYAYDAYRRFLASYAGAAWDLDLEARDLVERAKRRHRVAFKEQLPAAALRGVAEDSKRIIREAGFAAELDGLLAHPERQLLGAIRAVLASWERDRARRYRDIKGMSHGWQTAVIVQEMASGNRHNASVAPGMDETAASLTGVIVQSRMSERGFRTFAGDVKFSACGDDLVGGITEARSLRPMETLATCMPMLQRRLNHIDAKVRRFRGTDPEIEFTVDRGRLSVLQARMAQVDPCGEGSRFADAGEPALRGIGIRGGAFRGLVALDEEGVAAMHAELQRRRDRGDHQVDGVLLVLENPTPGEIPLILAADALVTATGGSTSHAAVAIHAVDDRPYCAVMSAAGLQVQGRHVLLCGPGGVPRHRLATGDVLSIHGQTGDVFAGVRQIEAAPYGGGAPPATAA